MVMGTTQVNTAASKLSPNANGGLTMMGTTQVNTAQSKLSPNANERLTVLGNLSRTGTVKTFCQTPRGSMPQQSSSHQT